MTDIERYADKAMFPAEPMASIKPSVSLLWMTPDPLGAVAAASRMYEGKPTYSLSDITDDERLHHWNEMKKTKLVAPLEFVKFHFFIEGVTREFTHQMVRQRTAAYAQESLRFAVKEDVVGAVRKPPSLLDAELSHSERNIRHDAWDSAVQAAEQAYLALIANGVPAEDARGLLPHAITTRLNYTTDLRNLLEHGGNRLCTQAQFEWKEFWQGPHGVIEAIRGYWEKAPNIVDNTWLEDDMSEVAYDNRWQFETLTEVFLPACYHAGKCPFKAEFDRGCTIRSRVDAFHQAGISSEEWGRDHYAEPPLRGMISAIRREEWANDPKAGWTHL